MLGTLITDGWTHTLLTVRSTTPLVVYHVGKQKSKNFKTVFFYKNQFLCPLRQLKFLWLRIQSCVPQPLLVHTHTCENRFRSNRPCVVLLNEIQSFILFLSSTTLTFFLIFYRAFRTQQHSKLYIKRIHISYTYMYTYVRSYKCIRRYIPTAYDNKLLDLFITIQVE